MNKVLIANRGEIAQRIIRTCRRLNISTVAVYSAADRHALHVSAADQACLIGAAAVEQSYLNIEALLAAAQQCGADAIHPGYGFLSENPDFANAVIAAGLIWIGPSPDAMQKMASKISAREIAIANKVPVIPACTLTAEQDVDYEQIARTVGVPLLIKSSAGGGGIGMREVHKQEDLAEAIDETRDQALRQFGDADLLIEKFIGNGRHVEVQLVGDQHGKLLHLFERDCSTQRRRQKLLEETPAAGLSDDMRKALYEAALRLAAAVNYHGVGTVEFLLEGDEFYLLEMNTRLQVEHGVTEAVCGLDLVELQLSIAGGQPLALEQSDIRCHGHAIEARVYAETPAQGFLPATGTIQAFTSPTGASIRIDSGVASGSEVSHHYDGMLCKLIAHSETREGATLALQSALLELRLAGLDTNQGFLRSLLASSHWQRGLTTTTVEKELSTLLLEAEPTTEQLDTALVAATLWQFLHYPPAADSRPWPGAYQLQRQSNWSYSGQQLTLDWRWAAPSQFEFPNLGLAVTVLDEGTDNDALLLEINGLRLLFAIHQDASKLWLWQQQLGNLRLEHVHAGAANGPAGQGGQCRSHGPGQVLRVLVSPGQEVANNEPLVVIESMKMESTLTAAQAGQVAEIAVAEGDLIESGQLLVRLEPVAEDAS